MNRAYADSVCVCNVDRRRIHLLSFAKAYLHWNDIDAGAHKNAKWESISINILRGIASGIDVRQFGGIAESRDARAANEVAAPMAVFVITFESISWYLNMMMHFDEGTRTKYHIVTKLPARNSIIFVVVVVVRLCLLAHHLISTGYE